MQSIYPRRNPAIPIITARPGCIRFGEHPEECQIGRSAAGDLENRNLTDLVKHWLNSMNGDCEARAGIDEFARSMGSDSPLDLGNHLEHVIAIGLRAGALIDSNAIPASSRWSTRGERDRIAAALTNQRILHPDLPAHELARTLDVRSESPIHIVGTNFLSHAIGKAAHVAGFPITTDPLAAAIIVFPSISHPEVSDYNFVELERRTHLHIGIRHTSALVGPLVIPGETSCFRCMHLHRVDQDSTWPMQTISWRNSMAHSTADPALIQITAGFSLCVIRAWLEGGRAVTNT